MPKIGKRGDLISIIESERVARERESVRECVCVRERERARDSVCMREI